MNEVWKAVVPIKLKSGETFEPYGYEVSNLGRVRSYRNRYGHGNGSGYRELLSESRIINGRPDKVGYIQYEMYSKGGKRKNVRGHVLVMHTFVGYPEAGMMICHWDDIKNNNKLENLRYGTRKENFEDMIRNKYLKLNADTLF
jgi:hypothetical protein